jgi:hypothetical protein
MPAVESNRQKSDVWWWWWLRTHSVHLDQYKEVVVFQVNFVIVAHIRGNCLNDLISLQIAVAESWADGKLSEFCQPKANILQHVLAAAPGLGLEVDALHPAKATADRHTHPRQDQITGRK